MKIYDVHEQLVMTMEKSVSLISISKRRLSDMYDAVTT